jgi:hypothetical protein
MPKKETLCVLSAADPSGLNLGTAAFRGRRPGTVRRPGYVRPAMVISDVANWVYNAARWTWHDPDGYNFISGPLADITLFGGGYAIARRHNCHVKGCWRIARSRVAGTDYIVCRRHHPHERPTAEKVLQAHEEAMRQRKLTAPDPTEEARER